MYFDKLASKKMENNLNQKQVYGLPLCVHQCKKESHIKILNTCFSKHHHREELRSNLLQFLSGISPFLIPIHLLIYQKRCRPYYRISCVHFQGLNSYYVPMDDDDRFSSCRRTIVLLQRRRFSSRNFHFLYTYLHMLCLTRASSNVSGGYKLI